MIFWRFGKKPLFALIFIGIILSLIASQWGAYNKPGATFFFLPTRMWQILMGSFAAFYLNMRGEIKISDITSNALSFIGLILIIGSYFFLDNTVPLPSLYALPVTLGTVFIIFFARPKTLTHKILSHKIPVAIGLISYSIYLWHQPLFTFMRHINDGHLTLTSMISLSLLTIILAGLTWYFIEQPCRKANISMRKTFCISLTFLISFILIGLVGIQTKGFEKFYYSIKLTPEQKETYLFIKKHTDYSLLDAMVDNGECQFYDERIVDDKLERFDQCYQKHGKAIVVIGDSHAKNLYNIIAKANYHPFVVGVLKGGCRVYGHLPDCHYKDGEYFVSQHHTKINHVVFHQMLSDLIETENELQAAFTSDIPYTINKNKVNAVIDYIERMNQHAHTYWIGSYAESRFNMKSEKNIKSRKLIMPQNTLNVFEKLDEEITKEIVTSSKMSSSQYISLIKWMNVKDRNLVRGDCLIHKDTDHFTRCGEDYWAEKLKNKFSKLLK